MEELGGRWLLGLLNCASSGMEGGCGPWFIVFSTLLVRYSVWKSGYLPVVV